MILKKFGWLRSDYLAKYLGMSWDKKEQNVINNLAMRLKKEDYILKKKVIYSNPGYWSLGKNGAKFIGSTQRNLLYNEIKHNDLVAELAINYLISDSNISIDTEYEKKQEIFGSASKNIKFPDLIINKKIAIEVEISRKNDQKLSALVSHYLADNFEEIIYYTDNKGIANKINYFAANNSRFKFRLFDYPNILEYVDYVPIDISPVSLPRDSSGQFINSAHEKLRQIGAFNK